MMAVRVLQYAKEFEGEYAKKGSTKESHKKATKKSKVKSKVVSPTSGEQRIIDKRLRRKYPQMYADDWPGRLKKKVQKELKAKSQKADYKRLEREIARLQGKERKIVRSRSKK